MINPPQTDLMTAEPIPQTDPAQPTLAVTVDAFLGGRISLRQPVEGYRAAIDPVLLAAAVSASHGTRIIDLGCGVGTAGLCLLARLPMIQCAGIDTQAALIDLAIANAAANGLAERYQARCGSILDRQFTADWLGADQVIANPPYLPKGEASLSAHPIKALANVESDAALADWVATAARLVKPGGVVTFIHRADRLPELLTEMRGYLGSLVIQPIQPKIGDPANRVLVRGRKGKNTPAKLLPALILHDPDSRYSAAAESILRDGMALPW